MNLRATTSGVFSTVTFAVAVAALALSLSISSLVHAQQQGQQQYEPCPDGTESIEFVFIGDEQSLQDNGWSLTCAEGLDQPEVNIIGGLVVATTKEGQTSNDGSTSEEVERIWNVPPGLLQYDPGYSTDGVFRRRECIPDTWTCTFTLTDLSSNGLDKDVDSFFVLRYGASTVDTYQQEEAFSTLEYCVGAGCGRGGGSTAGGIINGPLVSVPVDSECVVTRFDITLDDRPEDVTYAVTCGPGGESDEDVIIWEGSGFGPEDAGRNIEYEDCLHAVYCCKMSVTDASGNGLIDAVQTDSGPRYGSLHMEWNDEPVIAYEGEGDVVGFEVIDKSFGYTCSSPDDLTISKAVDGSDPDDQDVNGSSGISRTGMIILIVCMAILAIILIGLTILYCRRRRNQNKTASVARANVRAQKLSDEESEESNEV
mmetsp:Transcript_1097/g.2418  ORF Transcript_1097/g.2418 Transcript_1097/m.2418 type:complete len:426 (+) Transcript_1097:151-1428(+)